MKNGDALYYQIYQQLLEELRQGVYDGGKRLPTEAELTQRYFVSRITAKKALNLLAERGLVVRISGRGTFARKDCPVPLMQEPSDGARLIALVMGGYSSSFGLDIINGAMRRAEQLGLHLVVKETGNDQQRETAILQALSGAGVGGIIVQPAHGELYNQWLISAALNRFPLVMLDRSMPGMEVPFVGVDNARLSRRAVSEILRKGHRNVALVALEDDYSSSLKERMQGFAEAFADCGLPVKHELWLTRISERAEAAGIDKNTSQSHEIYVSAIAEHLRAHPEITAIFGTEYVASKAAWDAARRVGLKVPQQLSIVSFDFDSGYLGVHLLTHIKQPQLALGASAVEVLHDVLQGQPQRPLAHLLDGEWVEGDSLAEPAS